MLKQCDVLNKLRLFEARQELGEPISEFEHRLRMLAYVCNFTTKCLSQSCTAADTEAILIPALVKGLVNLDIQCELLAKVEQMSLEDLVTFVAIREADEIAATNVRKYVSSRPTHKDYKRNTKDVTNPVVQLVAATT